MNHVAGHVAALSAQARGALRAPSFLSRTRTTSSCVASAKEEARRLTALPRIFVGFENHLNYIHRPGGTLSDDEAWGLAALYNHLLDAYFRAVNGNTQVSATELRAMPLPARETIIELGRCVKRLADPTDGLDVLVMSLVAQYPEWEAATVG